jgi:hypothetical protein
MQDLEALQRIGVLAIRIYVLAVGMIKFLAWKFIKMLLLPRLRQHRRLLPQHLLRFMFRQLRHRLLLPHRLQLRPQRPVRHLLQLPVRLLVQLPVRLQLPVQRIVHL